MLAYFGASTGAASVIEAALFLPQVKAIVSRGGRPDMSMENIAKLKTPTLLIVGRLDKDVLNLNEKAFAKMTCQKKLEVVQGATHLFEEVGKMEIVSRLAAAWFLTYLH